MLALTVRSFGRVTDRIAERIVRRALDEADIRIDGSRPFDLRVHDPSFYFRVLRNSGLQLGETYMDGLWDCPAIDQFAERMLRSGVAGQHEEDVTFHVRNTWARLTNRQSRERATQVATAHYDLDTELYRAMLDETLTYTCAYWRDPSESLADAQRNKLDMVCKKLDLRRGERLLDIGCGFGGLAEHAARHYGATVVGITNATQHHEVASARCADLPVTIELRDYRDLRSLGTFDKISSIEMIEAVGPKNYTTYMDAAHAALKPGGRFLMQSFISNVSRYVCNEWFDRYIFPNGVSPSFAQLNAATKGSFGAPADVHDITEHYSPTLMTWDRNLREGWPTLRARNYDTRFRRMWHFYLTSIAGAFRAKDLRLCQIVYGKGDA
ncbi:MAG TPA: cyclopropane fatty acyl phospholipid synthase [Kofleriaceae bacterium]|jgi:cyclopropane-fatty-acyl-phospholipid synthase